MANRQHAMKYGLALIVLAVLPYLNALFNGFTIDDGFVYGQNQFVRDLANLRHLFSHQYFVFSNEASYRPVCTLTYFLDRAVWGDWVPGPHLTNLALYAAVVLAIFFLFRRLTESVHVAFLGGVIFALHPLHTEVVNNIAFREDLLVPLLLVLSWLLFGRAQDSGRKIAAYLGAAWLCYGLALFSKEGAVVFPLLAGILAWIERDGEPAAAGATDERARQRRSERVYFAGLVVLTACFLWVRFYGMKFPGEGDQARLGGSLAGTLLADVKIQARYVALFFVPVPLSALYPATLYMPRADVGFWVSLAALAAGGLAVLKWRHNRLLVGGALWWLVSLAPVANLYPIFNPMAERYLFLPSIGLTAWAADALARALLSPARRVVQGVLLCLAVVWAFMVWTRNPVWKDNLAVWTATARLHPESPTVLANLASSHFEMGNHDLAISAAERALQLARTSPEPLDPTGSYIALGCAYYVKGDLDRALNQFREAEKRLPRRFDMDHAVYLNIGMILDQRGELKDAATYYERAVAIDPFKGNVWARLAYVRLRLGDREGAGEAWGRARTLDARLPDFAALEAAHRKSSGQ